MARRLESLKPFAAVIKKVALSSQIRLFKDPDLMAVQPLARQTNFPIELQSNWAVDQLPYGERNTPPQNSKDPPKDPCRY